MSVNKCQEQVVLRLKTATIRKSTNLEVGDRVFLVNKLMGRKAGEPYMIIADVEITSVRSRKVGELSTDDAKLDGFPLMSAEKFQDTVSRLYKLGPDDVIVQVAWTFIEHDGPRVSPSGWVESWPCRKVATFEPPKTRASWKPENPPTSSPWR